MVGTPSAANASAGATPYEQETKLEKLFSELQAGFKKMEGIADPNKQANILKDLTNKMQEAKRYHKAGHHKLSNMCLLVCDLCTHACPTSWMCSPH